MNTIRSAAVIDSAAQERLTRRLIEFLLTRDQSHPFDGLGVVTRARAQALLQELIPAEIQVRGVSARGPRVVIAAPHVSFDQWSEYFCNRLTQAYSTGSVVAMNYRDRDQYRIPVNIGRHLHVNRPTESTAPGRSEHRTERAAEVYYHYIHALSEAGGGSLPLDVLIEIHSHRRCEQVQIATVGVGDDLARELHALYSAHAVEQSLPELLIEPLHRLHWQALSAKQIGSFQPGISRMAYHIEIPRGLRENQRSRARALPVFNELTGRIIAAAAESAA
ncbi:hypothetical protein HZB60_08395 [candidate division KSB1 bacterium]|nr:hypothetical protein [candidate division KSB1 bacterium]